MNAPDPTPALRDSIHSCIGVTSSAGICRDLIARSRRATRRGGIISPTGPRSSLSTAKILESDDTLGHGEHRRIGRRDFHYPRGSCYRYPGIACVTTRLKLPATLHTTPRYLALSVSSICRYERGAASYGGAADVANCIHTVCAKLAYSRPLASLRANAAAAARSFA